MRPNRIRIGRGGYSLYVRSKRPDFVKDPGPKPETPTGIFLEERYIDYFPGNNPLSVYNESNSVSLFTGSALITADADAIDGLFSLKLEGTGNAFASCIMDDGAVSGLQTDTDYKCIFWGKHGGTADGSESRVRLWNADDKSNGIDVFVTSTDWQQYEIPFTTTTNTTVSFTFHANLGTGNNGALLYLDGMQVVEA